MPADAASPLMAEQRARVLLDNQLTATEDGFDHDKVHVAATGPARRRSRHRTRPASFEAAAAVLEATKGGERK